MTDPIDLEFQQKTENEIEKIAIGISVAILAIVAERLNGLNPSDSMVAVYASMNEDLAKITKIITKGNDLLETKINEVFTEVAKGNDKWAEKFYRAKQLDQLEFGKNPILRDLLKSGIDNTVSETKTLVNTSAIGLVNADGEYKPLRESYTQIVGSAAGQMIASKESGIIAVQKAVDSLVENGVKVRYAKQTRDLYASLRMNIMGAYRHSMVAMRMQQGLEFGADGVEISAHSPCAPDHEPYQGRQFTFERFQKIQDMLDRDLVVGANCGHSSFPIIMGMAPTYSDAQLSKMNATSRKQVTIKGLSGNNLTMSRYEASQYQRSIENRIRQASIREYLTGEDMTAYVSKTTVAYKAISKQAGLPTMLERTRIYPLDML